MAKVLQHVENFRSGSGFLVALSVFLLLWFAVNSVLHFDAENLGLNLILSVEAAYAMPVLLMGQERRAREESDRLKEVLHATQEMIKLLRGIDADVDDIKEEVDRAVD